MSADDLRTSILFFLAILSSIGGIWWRVEGKIRKAEERAERVGRELADHKLYVAERYVSKDGLRETRDEIMMAISSVKMAVDQMTTRVDRIVEGQGSRSRSVRLP